MYCKEIEQITESEKTYKHIDICAHEHIETVNTEVTFIIREENMNYSIYGARIIGFPYRKLNSKQYSNVQRTINTIYYKWKKEKYLNAIF